MVSLEWVIRSPALTADVTDFGVLSDDFGEPFVSATILIRAGFPSVSSGIVSGFYLSHVSITQVIY